VPGVLEVMAREKKPDGLGCGGPVLV
jgi:hypothetical protein